MSSSNCGKTVIDKKKEMVNMIVDERCVGEV
jgi:hypothetical protein